MLGQVVWERGCGWGMGVRLLLSSIGQAGSWTLAFSRRNLRTFRSMSSTAT